MENYKRFGVTLQASKGCEGVGGANYAEYRMMALLFGLVLAVLFLNPGLLLWAILFFGLGLMAEGLGKRVLVVGIVISGILILSALFKAGFGSGFSSLIFGVIMMYSARSALVKDAC